jgi:hypothetical protein
MPRDPKPPTPRRNNTDYRPSRAAGPAKRKPKSVSDKAEYALKKLGPAKRKPKKDDMNIPDWVTKFGKIAVDPLGLLNKPNSKKAMRPLRPVRKRGASSASKAADSARKTKQGQAIAMDKVKTQRSVAAQSKRATGAAVKAATKKKVTNKRVTGYYEKPKGK